MLAAAAWFYMFVMLPAARYGHSKARLAVQRERVEHVLSSERGCLTITRLTFSELMELSGLLGIHTDEQAAGNWRFPPLHRLVIALYCLSAQQCFRRTQQQWGWAANSISNNVEDMVELIINRLDAPGSGTCSAHHISMRGDPLSGCSRACLSVQLMLSVDGVWLSRMHGWLLLAALLSSTTASAAWTQPTSAWSVPSSTRRSADCIPPTRSATPASSRR